MHHIFHSCNTNTSALPDKYTQHSRAYKVSADISGNASVPVSQLICNTSGTLKICPNVLTISDAYQKTNRYSGGILSGGDRK